MLRHTPSPLALLLSMMLVSGCVVAHAEGLILAPTRPEALQQRTPTQTVLLEAEVALQQGRADTAASIYQALLAQNPTAWEPLVGLAEIATRRQQWPLAYSYAQQATQHHPQQAESWQALAHVLAHWDKPPLNPQQAAPRLAEAKQALAVGLGLATESAPLLTLQGEIALDEANLTAARQALSQALKLQPNYVPAMRQAARYYLQERDYNKARQQLARALQLAPRDPAVYFLLAQLAQLIDRPNDALKAVELSELYDAAPLPARDWLKAQEYQRLGQPDKALPLYEALQAQGLLGAQQQAQLASLYTALGRRDAATNLSQEALRGKPALWGQWLAKAQAETRSSITGGSSDAWRRLIDLKPDNPQAWQGLVQSHLTAWQASQRLVPPVGLEQDLKRLNMGQPWLKATAEEQRLLQLDALKLAYMQQNGRWRDDQRNMLKGMATQQAKYPLVAVEALWLLGENHPTATMGDNPRLQLPALAQTVIFGDGAEQAQAADRMAAVGCWPLAVQWYTATQRWTPVPQGVSEALTLAQAQLTQGDVWHEKGKNALAQKQWPQAEQALLAALRYQPFESGWYLQLADAQEKQRLPLPAYQSMKAAVTLEAGLLQSPALAKRYKKLEKKALNAQKRADKALKKANVQAPVASPGNNPADRRGKLPDAGPTPSPNLGRRIGDEDLLDQLDAPPASPQPKPSPSTPPPQVNKALPQPKLRFVEWWQNKTSPSPNTGAQR